MGTDKYKVSIIIPNYNGKKYLERLLPSIANQTFSDYEVIVIDDFSPDRSVLEYIGTFIKDHENMRLIENTKNMGFVKTCNKGFGLSVGDYICLLTNDTEVKSDFVERNVEIMDNDASIGVLSCIVVDQRGNNWFSGGSFKAGLKRSLRDDFPGIRSVDWVAGTACFYRRRVFDEIGFLDEDFVMYNEDINFCLRVRNETDYKVCMFPEKLVTHYLRDLEPGPLFSAKKIRIAYYMHRNHMLLLRRYCQRYIPKVLLYNIGGAIKMVILNIVKLKPKYFLLSIFLVFLVVWGSLVGLFKRQSR